jgi:hypothetical protein
VKAFIERVKLVGVNTDSNFLEIVIKKRMPR